MITLEMHGISKNFGGVRALDDVSLSVKEGELFSIIGPNGSGKTTLFNIISGLIPADRGSISLRGVSITTRTAHSRAAMGIGRTFQNIMLFKNLTVLENVLVGRHSRIRSNMVDAVLMLKKARLEEKQNRERASEILEFVGLSSKSNEMAKNLAYGEQKRLEIARALATDPQILLLDEPAAGTNTGELKELIDLIARIHDRGMTILLIEHKMDMVMSLSDRIHVLNFGRTIAEGTPGEVAQCPDVIEAYLGKEGI